MLFRPSVAAIAPRVSLFSACYRPCPPRAPRGPFLLGHVRFGSCIRGIRKKDAEGIQEDFSHNPEWGHPDHLRKLKVALHVGYDGSGYRGLQVNRENAVGETVEHFLEQALFKVGGIRPANMGHFSKIGWSRASRTDKGVHSLSSVVALKMLCPGDGAAFETDPEGTWVADAMNAHLPSNIRIFSCQRVTKGFRSRQQAADRKYEYYLPASVIGVTGQDPSEDSRRLELMRSTLLMFEGTHAFHNYTTASLYGKKKNDYRKGRRAWREPEPLAEAQDSITEQQDDLWAEGEGEPDASPAQSAEMSQADADSSAEGQTGSGDGAPGAKRDVIEQWDRTVNLEWSNELAQQLGSPHYRHMRRLTVSDPRPLSEGGQPVIHVTLWGDSFMLHQIRKMIGTAAAVAVGAIPAEIATASLAPPARVNLPMVLAETLVLTDLSFFPFPGNVTLNRSPVIDVTGDRLLLREQGLSSQEDFRKEVLYPTLEEQLQSPEWDIWVERLRSLKIRPDEKEQFLAAHEEWARQRAELKAQRDVREQLFLEQRQSAAQVASQ